MEDEPSFGRNAEGELITDVQELFSFDLRLFHRRLDVGDDWQKIIQGHLFLDHILTKILEEELRYPDKMSLDRTSFASKVDLCSAMGLLHKPVEATIRRINKLRNNIAHDLHLEVLEQHSKEIRDLSSPTARLLIEEEQKSVQASLLTHCLKVVIIEVDLNRQHLARRREQKKKQADALNAAVENARNVLTETGLDAKLAAAGFPNKNGAQPS